MVYYLAEKLLSEHSHIALSTCNTFCPDQSVVLQLALTCAFHLVAAAFSLQS